MGSGLTFDITKTNDVVNANDKTKAYYSSDKQKPLPNSAFEWTGQKAAGRSTLALGVRMSDFRPVHVRDCQGVLWAFFQRYEGEASVSFEGDLQAFHLGDLSGCSGEETKTLRRQTTSPQLDFIVIPIITENIHELKARLSKPDVLGRNGVIIHVQIATEESPILIACDNFHHECTAVSTTVPGDFLLQLSTKGLIRRHDDAQPCSQQDAAR